jgi:hypothetical protein
MRIGLEHTLALAAAVCAFGAPAALAAGGVPGGGGAATPICGGGGGGNAGGCTTITDATSFTLNAPVGPAYPFETFSVKGNARYQVKDGARALAVTIRGLAAQAGEPLVLLVDNVAANSLWGADVTVSPTGTIDFSADSSRGDSAPDIGVFTQFSLYHAGLIDRVAAGTFH